MQVTVTAPYKKAVFTWSEDLQDCSVVAHGFEDDDTTNYRLVRNLP